MLHWDKGQYELLNVAQEGSVEASLGKARVHMILFDYISGASRWEKMLTWIRSIWADKHGSGLNKVDIPMWKKEPKAATGCASIYGRP